MITLTTLAEAIERRLGHEPDEAREEARIILSYFGFRDTIIDNAILTEDRRLFYFLSDAGLLQTSWESVPILDGRNWRIFYWHLDVAAIERLQKEAEAPTDEQVYHDLPDEVWSHTPSAT